MNNLLAIGLAVILSGCVPAPFYTETADEIRITYGSGGVSSEKWALYEPLYEKCLTEKKCIVDGIMVSADAFYAFGIPGVCYTKRAIWAPHERSNLIRYLPDPLAKHFRERLTYWYWLTVGGLDYEELLTIWPEGACGLD